MLARLRNLVFGTKPPPTPPAPRVVERLVWLSCAPCGDLGIHTVTGRNYAEIQTAIDALQTAHLDTHQPDDGPCTLAVELLSFTAPPAGAAQ